MTRLRIVFFGTAELACASLATLAAQTDFEIAGVVTQPDRPRGRDLKLQPTPVKELALRRSLGVLQPERARHESFVRTLAGLRPDLIVVAAYGQILPPAILDLPRHGCLNVHASLLPKYRGAAPIQWAILKDERETGVTIMKMDPGLDTGDILTQEATSIAAADDAQTLHDRLAELGARLLARTIPDYVAGRISSRPQPLEGASYARKIQKQDGSLDWRQPARTLWNRVRAFTPWPGAFTCLRVGSTPRLLKIWQAEVTEQFGGNPGEILQADKGSLVIGCGQQALGILSLQLEGGRRLQAQEFLAGHRLAVGEQLSMGSHLNHQHLIV
ncbi:MAG: methionyl-tRNA formyltransferase [Chloroflexi bacterium]|nr:methionyl-tRNA formyltransferase [Chloroflexota bacterium]